jgi:hypothetical protein
MAVADGLTSQQTLMHLALLLWTFAVLTDARHTVYHTKYSERVKSRTAFTTATYKLQIGRHLSLVASGSARVSHGHLRPRSHPLEFFRAARRFLCAACVCTACMDIHTAGGRSRDRSNNGRRESQRGAALRSVLTPSPGREPMDKPLALTMARAVRRTTAAQHDGVSIFQEFPPASNRCYSPGIDQLGLRERYAREHHSSEN